MEIEEAYAHLRQHLSLDVGRFFSPGAQLSLGVGKIYSGIRLPVYDQDRNIFLTATGMVYVLTHECDVDQKNKRPYNTEVLICPIIPFEEFVVQYQEEFRSDDALKGMIANLADRNIYRLLYVPHYYPQMPRGGILYLNQITNTHISAFSQPEAESVCAATGYGLEVIDRYLQNHLLRPKAEMLALSQ